MAETATPHDAVFKTFLSRLETARDFIEIHLPPALIRICKLDTLHLESGSFLEDSLRPYYSDILYSLETTCGRGYVHILIEHQSSPDKNMAFRLMRYAIAAMHQHLEAGNNTLPLVIPILFYQGRRSPYPWSLNWLEAFNDPDIAHQLFRQRDMAQLLDTLTVLLLLEQMSGQQLTTLINYIAQAGEAQDVHTLLFGLAQRVPQHGETLMTFAEKLRNEGMQEGRRVALQEIAEAMLKRGLDSEAIMEITGLSKDELQQLRH